MTRTTKITKDELKFYPSERLSDNDDGGGLALGTPITGEPNEIFSPISDVARVNGDFSARLLYAGVQRADDEPLIGANIAITQPPKSPHTSYLLFSAAKFGESRAEGVKRIESFVVPTIESHMTLLSSPTRGSKIIQVYQRAGEPLPAIGDTLCLDQNRQGYTTASQFVQIVKIEQAERTFLEGEREFTRMVLKLEISQPLLHDFVGINYPSPRYADAPCKVRETHVVDAGQYYGVKPVSTAAAAGDMKVHITDVMEKIVPTATTETVLADQLAAQTLPVLSDMARGEVRCSIGRQVQNLALSPIVAGTLRLGLAWSVVVKDENGQLVAEGKVVGSVDYHTGAVSLYEKQTVWTVDYKPAAVMPVSAESARIDIDETNRGYTYAITLPKLSIGSLVVSYMAQGKWYKLTDTGTGKLTGGSQRHGTGDVNAATGTVSLTLGELPDVGSSIFFNYANAAALVAKNEGMKIHAVYDIPKDETTAHKKPRMLTLKKGSQTAQVSADGRLSGTLSGYYADDKLYIENPTQEALTVSGVTGEYQTGEATGRLTDERVEATLINQQIVPGTLSLRVNAVYEGGQTSLELTDDTDGNLQDDKGTRWGTVDYEKAQISVHAVGKINVSQKKYITETYHVRQSRNLFRGPKYIAMTRQVFAGYEIVEKDAQIGTHFSFGCHVVGVDEPLTLTLTPRLVASFDENLPLVGVVLGGRETLYYDREGQIIDMKENAAVGWVDYEKGELVFNRWVQLNSTPHLAAFGADGGVTDSLSFALPAAPVRPSSLQVTATTLDGKKITATANNKGELETEGLTGFIDIKTGAVSLDFGDWVDVAHAVTEDWYASSKVVDGKIWKSTPVVSNSIRYNAVAVSHLPLNSTQIKIDTVRLPIDGRIPIFRRGDTVLIGNRVTTDIGSAHTAGQTVTLPRGKLDRLCVMDADGKPVAATLWDYDLSAGTVTWRTPLDLSGYKLPLQVMHAREEKNRIVSLDIDGTLTLMFPLKHSYEADTSYVSSVLLGGDLKVRTSVPFTQRNWDGVWRDTPNGSELLNRLNVKDYPIKLTDDGAINERWLIRWTSASQFELYGETLGFVLKADVLTDLAPINPATKKPYFTLPKEAFGTNAPWAAQDVIRFNTWGTLLPFWVLRAVQPNSDEAMSDGFKMTLFGDTLEA